MAFVLVREDESLKTALRKFRKKVQQEAIMRDYNKSSVYLKPGHKRRMEERRARKRMRRYLKRRRAIEI